MPGPRPTRRAGRDPDHLTPMLADRAWSTDYDRDDGDLVGRFYIPALREAVRYDRTTGFFSAGALTLAARGIEGLLANRGTMRLVVGCTLEPAEIAAIRRGEDPREKAALRLAASPLDPAGQRSVDALELLAWMVAKGHLEVKVAVPCDDAGTPTDDGALFHEKTGIVEDRDGSRLAWTGSLNETRRGWQDNWESFTVFRSWRESAFVESRDRKFRTLWEGRTQRLLVMPVPQAVREDLFRFLPKDDRPPKRFPEPEPDPPAPDPAPTPDPPVPTPPRPPPPDRRALVWGFLRDAARPENPSFGEATAPVVPWPHQARAFDRLWNRWPPRLLIADEVGLGKTIQAGLLLRQAWLTGQAKRVLVLAPKAVLGQWRIELREKFNLNWPVYDGRHLVCERPPAVGDAVRREVGPREWVEEPAVIASSQLLWRKDRSEVVREAPRWDLVVLDEAHHARRSGAGSRKRGGPNRLLRLMRELAGRTDGLLLLTATPMQVDAVELWDLLALLGLPDEWTEEAFLRFFEDAGHPNPTREMLARMAALFRSAERAWGATDREGVRRRTGLSPFGAKKVLDRLRDREATGPLADLSVSERRAAVSTMRAGSPVRRLVSRNTRDLLRRYAEAGAEISIARREVGDRFVALPAAERELYEAVERYISETYDRAEKAERAAVGFVMTIYRRRLASSFRALRATLERRAAGIRGDAAADDPPVLDEDLPDDDLDPEAADEAKAARLERQALAREELGAIEELLAGIRRLPRDAKFERLRLVLGELRSVGYGQVMVFTQFTDTMDFLREELTRGGAAGDAAAGGGAVGDGAAGGEAASGGSAPGGGLRLMCYSGRGGEIPESGGRWRSIPREDAKKRFAAGEAEVLLCTDAAAEGLNFQFCGALVNYDMPWNPMRVEQRIGRLDRVGQKHRTIRIENLHYEDTVETDVYRALRDRIGLFEDFVGRLQPILAQLPGRIREAALGAGSASGDPEAARKQVVSDLERAAAAAEGVAGGRPDLDDAGEEELRMPERPASPVTMADLDRVLRSPELLPPGWEVRAMSGQEYAVRLPGMESEVRVTTKPAYYEEHSASLELWSPGGSLFPSGPEVSTDTSPDAPPGAPPEEVARYPTLKSILDE